jgi:hypothetical protein
MRGRGERRDGTCDEALASVTCVDSDLATHRRSHNLSRWTVNAEKCKINAPGELREHPSMTRITHNAYEGMRSTLVQKIDTY